MTTLITGGSKCGKSSYAEKLLDGFAGRKIYIATMEPFGSDAQEAIKRHRLMRKGKGFETLERFTDIGGADIPKNCAVLLECVGPDLVVFSTPRFSLLQARNRKILFLRTLLNW